MNLNAEIQKATDQFIKNELQKLVEQKVSKMVDSVLSDIFSSYGETAKSIKDKISEALDVSLVEFGLADYNAMVAKAIVSELGKEIDLKPITEIVRGLVGKSEIKQIKMYDLAEKVKAIAMENDDEQNYSGSISFYVEENQRFSWLEIYADLSGDKKKEDCAVKVMVSKDSARIFSMKTTNYWHKEKEISQADMVNMSSIENLFFSLYNNQVLIINDYEDLYLEWDRD